MTYCAEVPMAENSMTVRPLQTLRKIPDSSPRQKPPNNDIDAISVTASEENMNEPLSISEPGATINSKMDVNEELLTELSVGLIDKENKAHKVTTQLAGILNKQWAKKLAPEKITSILEKYSQPKNC